MRRILWILLMFLFCFSGCEKSGQTEMNSFSVVMERNNALGPCNRYNVKIESDGKVNAERNCIFFVECESYESNGISVEKRKCSKDESERLEKQLSNEELKELIEEIKKSNFFSFQDDYSYNSKNCSQTATDLPNIVLSIKIEGKEKRIEHYYGCEVNTWFIWGNALQPLNNLEQKIDKIAGTENWTKGRK